MRKLVLVLIVGLVSCNSVDNSMSVEETTKFIKTEINKELEELKVDWEFKILSHTIEEVSTYDAVTDHCGSCTAEGGSIYIPSLEDSITKYTMLKNNALKSSDVEMYGFYSKYLREYTQELKTLKEKIKNNPISFKYTVKLLYLVDGVWLEPIFIVRVYRVKH